MHCLHLFQLDFGGQDLLSSLHHLFLTDDGVYLVIINGSTENSFFLLR